MKEGDTKVGKLKINRKNCSCNLIILRVSKKKKFIEISKHLLNKISNLSIDFFLTFHLNAHTLYTVTCVIIVIVVLLCANNKMGTESGCVKA